MAKPTEMEKRVGRAICKARNRDWAGGYELTRSLCLIDARAAIAAMGKAKAERQSNLRFSDALERMEDGLSMRRAEWPEGQRIRIPENVPTIVLCSSERLSVPWWPSGVHLLADDWEVHDECAE